MTFRRLLLFLSIIILLNNALMGQQEEKINWHSELKLGMSLGIGNFKGIDDIPRVNSETVYSFSTANGVVIDKFILAVEIGLNKWGDDFQFPISISPRFEFKPGNNSFFLFGKLGILLGTRKPNYFLDEENGHVFTNLGIGYKFVLFNKEFSV